MKKIVLLFIVIAMIFSAVSCLNAGNNNAGTVVFKLDKEYVKPVKKELTEKQQETADKCYKDLVSKHERLAVIPREMLYENVYSIENTQYVTFAFCLGGIATNCKFQYVKKPGETEGSWTIQEDDMYKQFYTTGITAEAMDAIRTAIEEDIDKSINEYHLKKDETSEDGLRIYWNKNDKGLFAQAECIANVTEKTTKKFGCGDHSHIFGNVFFEIADGNLKIVEHYADAT